jgi:diaminohydroxyphosphoribosylaminopyrimidine deaminase/5-amino-6-(5-phosphoribosylamino)uracil reductase
MDHEREHGQDHETWMREAIAQGERARGSTGDNPWVGCVIVLGGRVVARGHTQGPGEDHAEIGAIRDARALGVDLTRCTLYSTLEPCSFHGRTPSCARVIAGTGVRLVVVGMRDPHPRVDGVGAQMLREAGLEVLEGVCEREVRVQLAPWVLREHPHEPRRRAQALLSAPGAQRADVVRQLAATYGIDLAAAEALTAAAEAAA